VYKEKFLSSIKITTTIERPITDSAAAKIVKTIEKIKAKFKTLNKEKKSKLKIKPK
jgi:hypothetical protein